MTAVGVGAFVIEAHEMQRRAHRTRTVGSSGLSEAA